VNPGIFSFPRKQSFITRPYDRNEAFEGGGYMTLSAAAMKGDVLAGSASLALFPIQPGVVPSGLVAGAALAADAAITGVAPPTATAMIDTDQTPGGLTAIAYAVYSYGFTAAVNIEASTANGRNFNTTLVNGEYVAAYVFSTGTQFKFGRFNSAGTLQGALVAITPTGAMSDIGVAGMTNGNFVVGLATQSRVSFMVYDTSNAIVVAETVVEAADTRSVAVVALTGGGFMLSYVLATGALKYVRYTAAGVIQGSIVTHLASGASITLGHAAAGLSSGGFVLAWCGGGSTFPVYATFDATGTQVVANTTIIATVTLNISCCGLNDGGFVVAYTNSSTDFRFSRYNASGVVQGSAVVVEAVNAARSSACSTPSGDIVLAYATSANLARSAKYNGKGDIVAAPATYDTAGAAFADISCCSLLDNRCNFLAAISSSVFRQCINTFSGSATFALTTAAGVLQGPITAVNSNPIADVAVAGIEESFVVSFVTLSNTPSFSIYDRDGVIALANQLPEAVYTTVIAACSLQNGNFVVAWEDVYQNRLRFGIYTPAGVLVTPIFSGESTTVRFLSLHGLSSGGFVAGYVNASGQPRFAIYSAAGAQITAPTVIEAITTATKISVAGSDAAGFIAVYNGALTTVRAAFFNNVGGVFASPFVVDTIAAMTDSSVARVSGGDYVIAYSGTAVTKVVRYSRLGVIQGAIETVTATNYSFVSAFATAPGDYGAIYGNAAALIRRASFNSPNIIVGVALRNGGAGALIPVATEGYATLREDWGNYQRFSHYAATPRLGNAGSFFGKTANLTGL